VTPSTRPSSRPRTGLGAFVGGLLALAVSTGAAQAADPPARIVSLGGAVTEIVYALGAGPRVIGVDTTSLYPPAARHLPTVGYLRALGTEGLLSLKPDLIVAADEAGPPPVFDQLRALKVPFVRMEVTQSPEQVAARIRAVATAIGAEGAGAAIADAVEADFAALAAARERLPRRPRVLFILSVGQGPLMAAGQHTAADAVIALAGGTNAVAGYRGYKPLVPEAAIAADPDVLLLTDQGLEALGGKARALALPQIAHIPAARDGRLIAMDALYLLGLGPRSPQAARDLMAMMLGEAAAPPLPPRPWTAP